MSVSGRLRKRQWGGLDKSCHSAIQDLVIGNPDFDTEYKRNT